MFKLFWPSLWSLKLFKPPFFESLNFLTPPPTPNFPASPTKVFINAPLTDWIVVKNVDYIVWFSSQDLEIGNIPVKSQAFEC